MRVLLTFLYLCIADTYFKKIIYILCIYIIMFIFLNKLLNTIITQLYNYGGLH